MNRLCNCVNGALDLTQCEVLNSQGEKIANLPKPVNKYVCYLNCVRILCKHGANPNCSSRSSLTPLHVLAFAAGENIALSRPEEKEQNFLFVRQLLDLLLRHGLNPNVRFGQRTHHVLHSLVDMVQNARGPTDLDYIYDLTLTLLRHGADPNVNVTSAPPSPPSSGSSSCRRADDDVICHSQSSLFLRRGNNQPSSSSSSTSSSSRGGYSSHGSADVRTSGGRYGQTQGSNQRNPAEYVLCQYVLLLCRGGKEEFLLDPQMRFANLIWLYYLSMGHQELYSCLKVLYTHTGAAVAAPVRGVLFNLVRELYLRPRTLKQMCRVTIYNAIGRCPDMHVSKLPLPASLKDYILNFVP